MTEALDITASQRKIILALLKRYLPNVTVWAYGSRVKWTARPQSDLDMVAFVPPEQKGRISQLKEAFEESDLPFRVDLFVWDEVPEQFRMNIEAERVVLQEASPVETIQGWKRFPFTEAVQINPKVLLKRGEGYPFVDMQAVDPSRRYVSESERREFTSGGARFEPYDTLMARITPCLENGKIAQYVPKAESTGPAFGSTEFIVIRGRDGVTGNNFTYYLTKYDEFRQFAISQMTGSSGRQRVPAESLSGFVAQIPPLPEQRAIAHILGSLDDKIELNRRMNETLEGMAQALFKSWFVDFDPVIDNALAAGNPIPEELQPRAALRESLGDARKTFPEDIRVLFPSEFEQSEELGWAPKGWKQAQIGSVIELAYGKALAAKIREPGPYPVYGSGGISGYNKEAIAEGPGIIVGRKGTVGSVYWESEDFFPIDTVFFVKLKKKVPLYWVYQNLMRMDIASLGADSAVPGVNRNAVYAKKWILPGKDVLNSYWTQLGPFVQKHQEQFIQNKSLESLRNTLLPKLLSGEIRIPETEKLARAVG